MSDVTVPQYALELDYADQQGDDSFEPSRFTLTERIGEPFHLDVEVVRSNAHATVDLSLLLGARASFSATWRPDPVAGQVVSEGAVHRRFTGIVTSVELVDIRLSDVVYRLEVRSEIWLLSQQVHSRIFVGMTTQEIVESVFADAGLPATLLEFDIEDSGYEKRERCTQYFESDLDFIDRLLAEEGMVWFEAIAFAGTHRVAGDDVGTPVYRVVDSAQRYRQIFEQARSDGLDGQGNPICDFGPIDILLQRAGATGDRRFRVYSMSARRAIRPYRTKYLDYDFKRATSRLGGTAEVPDPSDLPDAFRRSNVEEGLVSTRYPMSYVVRTGEAGSDASHDATRERLAMVDAEARRASAVVYTGHSVVMPLRAGCLVDISAEAGATANEDLFNRHFLVICVVHSGSQTSGNDAVEAEPYTNTFELFPKHASYFEYRRPASSPRRPADGLHVAVVAGATDGAVEVDDHARIRVRFPWDERHPKGSDPSDLPWVRVASTWAGEQMGLLAIPRVGNEVLVQFEDGDPDRPIVIGSVYNGLNKPPTESSGKVVPTRTILRGRSVDGDQVKGVSAPANQLYFDDKADQEEIRLNAARDEVRIAGNDARRFVKNHDLLRVANVRDVKAKVMIHSGEDVRFTSGKSFVIQGISVASDLCADLDADPVLGHEPGQSGGPSASMESTGNLDPLQYATRAETLIASRTDEGTLHLFARQAIVLQVGNSVVRIKPEGVSIEAAELAYKVTGALDMKSDRICLDAAVIDLKGGSITATATGELKLSGSTIKENA